MSSTKLNWDDNKKERKKQKQKKDRWKPPINHVTCQKNNISVKAKLDKEIYYAEKVFQYCIISSLAKQ